MKTRKPSLTVRAGRENQEKKSTSRDPRAALGTMESHGGMSKERAAGRRSHRKKQVRRIKKKKKRIYLQGPGGNNSPLPGDSGDGAGPREKKVGVRRVAALQGQAPVTSNRRTGAQPQKGPTPNIASTKSTGSDFGPTQFGR